MTGSDDYQPPTPDKKYDTLEDRLPDEGSWTLRAALVDDV